VPLNELMDINELAETEITGAAMLEKIKKFYVKSSKKIAKERTEYYQNMLKVKPKSIEIVKVGGRWGSCTSEKHITYNFMIATLPIELIDYIVVHELCHLHHMNHDRSFWRKVGSILPDYKKRQDALHKIGGEE
jgi:predicted metal-dependent hydrolase